MNNQVRASIAKFLSELFAESGKKKIDLAKYCGVGSAAVSNWCNGTTGIDVERIPDICNFFDITIAEFWARANGEIEKQENLVLTVDEMLLLDAYRATNTYFRPDALDLMQHIAERHPLNKGDREYREGRA